MRSGFVDAFRARSAALRSIAGGMLSMLRGERRTCVACNQRVLAFLPWRGGRAALPELSRELGMVGSDVDHFGCPRCGSTDRERHLILYFSATGLSASFSGARILHFAPEPAITRLIESAGPAEYIKADIAPQDSTIVQIDLERIPFADGHFDWVISNHVLEHVRDLDAATREVHRVLRLGGRALLQAPWCAGLSKTIEDASVQSPRARWALYGQDDHVRLFGSDVYDRIGASGLRPDARMHADVLSGMSPREFGVNPDEDFMVFVR